MSVVRSVFRAAMLGDIGLIQLWTYSGERLRMDQKHPVTGTHSPIPYTQSHSRQCLYNCCSSFVMISTGGTLLHYAAANEHHACVARDIRRSLYVCHTATAQSNVVLSILLAVTQ